MVNKITALTLLALVSLFAGCGKEEPKADPYDTPYARMHDPAYLKAIEAKAAEQKVIMKEMMAARKEIAAYKTAHPGEAVPAELEKKLTDAADKMEENRKAAQQMVKDRILKENAAVDSRKKSENLKKDNK